MKLVLAILLVATSCVGQMLPEEYLLGRPTTYTSPTTYTTNWATNTWSFTSEGTLQTDCYGNIAILYSGWDSDGYLAFNHPAGWFSGAYCIEYITEPWEDMFSIPGESKVIGYQVLGVDAWTEVTSDSTKRQELGVYVGEHGGYTTNILCDIVLGTVTYSQNTPSTITEELASVNAGIRVKVELIQVMDQFVINVDNVVIAVQYYTED